MINGKLPVYIQTNQVLEKSLVVQPDCLKGRVVCGTVYGDMHLKDLLELFARVTITVLDFYLVLHDLQCRKITCVSLL